MKFYIKSLRPKKKRIANLLLVMKLTIILLVVSILHVSANGFAQKLSYTQKNVTLKQVFNEIRKQTGYDIIWPQRAIKSSTKIDVEFENTPLSDVLNTIFKGKPMEYSIEDKTIVIKESTLDFFDLIKRSFNGIEVRGKVMDNKGEPLAGALVAAKGHKKVLTDQNGNFQILNVELQTEITITYIGFAPKVIKAAPGVLLVKLELSESALDEVQVMAYGTTSKRLNTGNIASVSGEDLSKAPTANILNALDGRVAGMVVTPTGGMPGAQVKIQIRGRTRVDEFYGASDEPLFIIDGVPMATGNNNINLLGSAISGSGVGGLSPFSTINTSDIESVEVLKDADATAIYGSRGASGVILITTKKGKPGSVKVDVKSVNGFSTAQKPDLLNTSEYLAMRKEAFKNDGIAMTNANAYDILLWDTTRNNLVDQLIGGTAMYSTTDARLSGGTEQVLYTMGGSYYRETNVFPKPVPNTRANAQFGLNMTSLNKKFTADFKGSFAYNHSQAPGTDLSLKLTLAPNYKLYNDDGSIAWNEGGINSENPLAYMLQTYSAKTVNLNANAMIGYRITNDLTFRTSIGYNSLRNDEIRNTPKASLNPTSSSNAFSAFGNSLSGSTIIEPQLNYVKSFGRTTVSVLAGGTLQSQVNDARSFTLRDYTSDDFLGTFKGVVATSFLNPSSSDSEYKYAAYFGRVTIDFDKTYALNFSGRRDGSSRFGPNYRYSSFGSVGGLWIFTNETAISDFTKDVLSFGKIRASYGNTGNDKIGDYKYIDLYESNIFGPTYNNLIAYSPVALFRPDLHWERNNKFELALELGFLEDRVLFNTAYYRYRSNDPLVQYPLATSTGFSNIVTNLNGVVVQNKGLEFTVDSRNFKKKNFEWRTSFNISFPENKLIKYPGLENSSYASSYVIGKNLNLRRTGNFIGVNPQTGLYVVEDLDGDGRYSINNLTGDVRPKFDTEPDFHGGISNDVRYKNFTFSVFMNFTKQWTQNWRTISNSNSIGAVATGNVSRYVLKRWQNEGDITDVQKFTTRTYSSSLLEGTYGGYVSDASWENMFYVRVRTVEMTYSLPKSLLDRLSIRNASILLQGQNLFTFTAFRGNDPQTVYFQRLAPLRTMVVGFQLGF